MAMLILALVTALQAPGDEQVLLLDGFESDPDLARWVLTAARAERVREGVTEGAAAVHVWFDPIPEGQSGWPAIKWTSGEGRVFPTNDWRGYDLLAFDVTNLDAAPLRLKLRLDDAESKTWTTQREIPAHSQTTYEVPVTDIGGGLDRSRMVHLDIFLSSPREPHEILLDNVRLVARPLELLEETVRDDPFHDGRARLAGRLTRAAPWRIDIVDAAGRPVNSAAGEGAQIRYQWDRRDAAGKELPAGNYVARLTLTDAAFGDRVTERTWLAIRVADGGPPFLIWPSNSGEKVFLDDYPRRDLTTPLRLDMVKGEVEAMQIVVQAGMDLKRVNVRVENLAHEGGGESPSVTVYQVGYVDCGPPPYPVTRNGWWPDPLLPVDTFDIADRDAQPIWLSWRSATDTAPGVHRGDLVIEPAGVPPTRLPMEITVHDVTLPTATRMRTAFATYDGFIKKMHGEPLDEWMMKYWEFIADHRINPDNIYRAAPPRIEVLEHFHERGQLNAFNVKYIGKRDGPYTAADKAALAAQLDPFVAELRKRPAILAKAYFYGFDEIPPERFPWMRDIFGWLKERYPEIPTMTTARDASFGTATGLNDVVDIWVPLTPRYDRDLARQVRADGTHVWWYTCIGPRHPYCNWFIEYEAIEARLIWWQAYRNEVEGHLYYTMTRWPLSEHPIDPAKGARTDWPPASYKTANGDGSLICAGPDGPLPTIRIENIRDGLEDMELLAMLDDLRRGREGAAPPGREFVERLSPSLTEYTHDTAELLAVRREVIEAILKLRG